MFFKEIKIASKKLLRIKKPLNLHILSFTIYYKYINNHD